MDGPRHIQFRAPPEVVTALLDRAGDESLGMTARWVVEQYLAMVHLARTAGTTPQKFVQMVLHDDDVRRGRIKP